MRFNAALRQSNQASRSPAAHFEPGQQVDGRKVTGLRGLQMG